MMEHEWPAVPTPSQNGVATPTTIIADRYALGQFVGAGAIGEVFQAQDLKFSPPRAVAIKLIYPQHLLDPQMRDNIRNEASIAARFSHPHILRVLDFEVEPDAAYIVMEYAPGGSLQQKLHPDETDAATPLAFEKIAKYLEQMALALDEAHRQGVIHRDIKPQNILLDKDDNVLLADFGLAMTSYARNLIATEAWGTPDYAAPEVWGGEVGQPSDIYALGILVYEMLTGQPPYQTEGDPTNLEQQHRHDPVPSLNQYNPFPNSPFSREFDSVIKGALDKEPLKRYKTAKDFYTRFKFALDNYNSRAEVALRAQQQQNLTANRTIFPADDDNAIDYADYEAQKRKKTARAILGVVAAVIGMVVFIANISSNNSRVFSRVTGFGQSYASTPIVAAPTPTIAPLNFTSAEIRADVIKLPNQYPQIQTAAWSPDGKTVAISSRNNNIIYLWNSESKKIINQLSQNAYSPLVWSPDGKLFVSSAENDIVLRDNQGKRIAIVDNQEWIHSFAWSPDGKFLATVGDSEIIKLWSASEGGIKVVYSLKTINQKVQTLIWSPDSKNLAFFGNNDFLIRLWQPETDKIIILKGHTGSATALSWSPDSTRLASSSYDSTIHLWNVNGNDLATLSAHSQTVSSVAFSPDGKYLASGSADKTVRIWNADGSDPIVLTGNTTGLRKVAWSPDSSKLASLADDGTIWVWTAADKKPLHTLRGQVPSTDVLLWSPNSKSFLAMAKDFNLQLWSLIGK